MLARIRLPELGLHLRCVPEDLQRELEDDSLVTRVLDEGLDHLEIVLGVEGDRPWLRGGGIHAGLVGLGGFYKLIIYILTLPLNSYLTWR